MTTSLHRRALAALDVGHDRAHRAATLLSWLCFGLALAHAATSLCLGWDMPLLDRHAFRQTHTALSARTIAQGGPILGYETPVFGAPWAIPLEFPLYQLVVVALQAALGTSLDLSGRIVSAFFYLATLVPLWHLLRELDVDRNARTLALALFLVSPLYVYWSRAFLIESTVLFFAVSACAIGLAELRRERMRPGRLALASACAVAASVSKLMTAYGWLAMLALLWLVALWREGSLARTATGFDHARLRAHGRRLALFAGALFVAPLAAALAWTSYSDGFKGNNLLARDLLLASAQTEWNFGTWAQKTAPETWQLLWDRTLSETLGHTWLFVVCVLAAALLARRTIGLVAPLFGLFAIYATFTNLHVVHDYYQCATGLFVIVAMASGLSALARSAGGRAWLVPLIAAIALWQSVRAYDLGYRVSQEGGYALDGRDIGHFIRARTPADSTLLIYGDDWSSVLPYYAERRALMNRWNHPLTDPRMQLTMERTVASGHPFSAVVACWGTQPQAPELAHAVLGTEIACEPRSFCTVCTRQP